MLFATVIAELQALAKCVRIPFERLATITIRSSKLCHGRYVREREDILKLRRLRMRERSRL